MLAGPVVYSLDCTRSLLSVFCSTLTWNALVPVLRTHFDGQSESRMLVSPSALSGMLANHLVALVFHVLPSSWGWRWTMSAYLISRMRNAITGTGCRASDHVPIQFLDARRSCHVADILYGWMRVPTSSMNATWLILPVVICLSQRLSHACVSMN